MHSLEEALRRGTVVLDGGLSTHLADAGYDLSDELWSAKLLHDAPDAIVDTHLAFLRAGASVVTTASYQGSVDGFARRGYDDPEGLLRRSVSLARDAIDQMGTDRPLWIAASVGPYGAVLADGSEYRGNYGLTVRELVAFHRPRIQILAEAEPDVLALETVPDIREAEALLTALAGTGVKAWLSYTVDGQYTRAGQSIVEAFALAEGVDDIIAVGVNCCRPGDVEPAVRLPAGPVASRSWPTPTAARVGRLRPYVDGAGRAERPARGCVDSRRCPVGRRVLPGHSGAHRGYVIEGFALTWTSPRKEPGAQVRARPRSGRR